LTFWNGAVNRAQLGAQTGKLKGKRQIQEGENEKMLKATVQQLNGQLEGETGAPERDFSNPRGNPRGRSRE